MEPRVPEGLQVEFPMDLRKQITDEILQEFLDEIKVDPGRVTKGTGEFSDDLLEKNVQEFSNEHLRELPHKLLEGEGITKFQIDRHYMF